MVMLDGIPINAAPDYDQAEGWLVTAEVAVATINEFRRQVSKRQAALRRESEIGPRQPYEPLAPRTAGGDQALI
ncbi:hypothetical protein [Micromonospora sp. MA102]|uniref:hypothetical protein n=1 Tax=Micromonospora sp. MA102 TaxID=2952755 RepID=UPI0021C69EEC|nr:hypothetical protein [Micromonospora sp. MA102]